MAGRPVLPLVLKDSERRELERRARSGAVPVRDAERARIILYRAAGRSQAETARLAGCSARIVSRWVGRFRRMGLKGLSDKQGRGRPPHDGGLKPKPARKITPSAPAKRTASKRRATKGKPAGAITPGAQSPGAPTMRTVARAVGVSPMTVSRVLRGEKSVRPQLCDQVMAEARRQDYRPQPQVQKLMVHLRQARRKCLQGSICALTSEDWPVGADTYYRHILHGARSRADALGFCWNSLLLADITRRQSRSLRFLQGRGVEGILLLPTAYRCRIEAGAIWQDFSVLSTTYSIEDPGFHRVVPDHFSNIQLLCKRLTNLGCRRIGLVIPHDADERVHHHWSGSMAAFHFRERRVLQPLAIQSSFSRGDLQSWFERYNPDGIITESCWRATVIARWLDLAIPGPVAFAAASHSEADSSCVPAMDEQPESIGERAIDRLARMISHGERGVPRRPSVTMIQGLWRPMEAA